MTPGDIVKISELKAGDVFEWSGVICILGNGLESNESWDFWVFETQWFSKTSKHIRQKVTYLGPLTAEMVREMLKK